MLYSAALGVSSDGSSIIGVVVPVGSGINGRGIVLGISSNGEMCHGAGRVRMVRSSVHSVRRVSNT